MHRRVREETNRSHLRKLLQHFQGPTYTPPLERPFSSSVSVRRFYSSKLDSLCSSVKPRDDTRTDRTYARWRTSATTGCVDGDVVSYCVSSSPSPSPTPSPSASPAGECDRCASLVGEQWTGLSGKPCFDLQIRLKFLFSVPGSINAHINVFMTQTHYEHPRFSKTSTPSTSRIASMSIGSKT